eukprot:scaffold360_cov374-Pavlova_lutheri.AAC.3
MSKSHPSLQSPRTNKSALWGRDRRGIRHVAYGFPTLSYSIRVAYGPKTGATVGFSASIFDGLLLHAVEGCRVRYDGSSFYVWKVFPLPGPLLRDRNGPIEAEG